MKFEMVDCENTILDLLADKRTTRDTIVVPYAFSIVANHKFGDVGTINRAIIKRWSFHALDYIKTKAWKLVNQKEATN